jgi:hypothetical protein
MSRTYFQESEDLLTKIIVKVGILGVRHVVDEHKTTFLGVDALQRDIQLVYNTL